MWSAVLASGTLAKEMIPGTPERDREKDRGGVLALNVLHSIAHNAPRSVAPKMVLNASIYGVELALKVLGSLRFRA